MVTVHDVAARSGVSIATVSRTLRVPHRVSGDTRDRVLAAIEELGYRPNRAAASLRRGRTGVIAFVVPDIENPYFASLTKGAQAASRARGYGLVVVDTTESAEVESEEIRALRSQIDGIILVSSRLPDEQLLEVAEGAVSVLINRDLGDRSPATPSVAIDEAAASDAAVAHLAELGHRRLAYVGGPAHSWSQERRARGVRDAVAARPGLTLAELADVVPTAAGGRAVADAVLGGGVTAVLAYNDLVALGLLAEWGERGVRVPEDISLVGFDNTFVAELSSPLLTSVGTDLRDAGEAAVELLLQRVEATDSDAPAAYRTLRPELVVRASTAPVRTAD
ncbi:MAG: LacI family DNA-binding transcriptional regulator [Microbacterium chocolatum]|nr:LacI family DNA-binding transcriptional regulator [Microbacterium chocolatum]